MRDAAATSTDPAVMRGARLSLGLLLAINLFNYIDRYILAAVLPRIGIEFFPGESVDSPAVNFKLGLLATAFLVSYMVIAPVFGWLGDRMNRWLLIGIGVILWSAASGASGLAATFGILLITRVFVGIGEAAYGPTAPTIIADLYPVKRRGAVLAWFYAAIPVGTAIGYAMGGQIAEWSDSWRWPFYVVVPPGIALGIWCFLRAEPPRGMADAGTIKRKVRWADYAVLARTPSYVINVVGMTAMTFAIGGISFWMPKYLIKFRGLENEGAVSMLFGGIVVVTGLASTLLGGYLGDRLRGRWSGSYFLVAGFGMLIGFPFFLMTLWVPFPMAWVCLGISVFCLFLNTGPTNTILANVTHPAIRSSAFALCIFIIHAAGDAISPPIIGAIIDATASAEHPGGDMNAGFLAVSIAILVGAVAWLVGARGLGRDTQLAPTRLPE